MITTTFSERMANALGVGKRVREDAVREEELRTTQKEQETALAEQRENLEREEAILHAKGIVLDDSSEIEKDVLVAMEGGQSFLKIEDKFFERYFYSCMGISETSRLGAIRALVEIFVGTKVKVVEVTYVKYSMLEHGSFRNYEERFPAYYLQWEGKPNERFLPVIFHNGLYNKPDEFKVHEFRATVHS